MACLSWTFFFLLLTTDHWFQIDLYLSEYFYSLITWFWAFLLVDHFGGHFGYFIFSFSFNPFNCIDHLLHRPCHPFLPFNTYTWVNLNHPHQPRGSRCHLDGEGFFFAWCTTTNNRTKEVKRLFFLITMKPDNLAIWCLCDYKKNKKWIVRLK